MYPDKVAHEEMPFFLQLVVDADDGEIGWLYCHIRQCVLCAVAEVKDGRDGDRVGFDDIFNVDGGLEIGIGHPQAADHGTLSGGR